MLFYFNIIQTKISFRYGPGKTNNYVEAVIRQFNLLWDSKQTPGKALEDVTVMLTVSEHYAAVDSSECKYTTIRISGMCILCIFYAYFTRLLRVFYALFMCKHASLTHFTCVKVCNILLFTYVLFITYIVAKQVRPHKEEMWKDCIQTSAKGISDTHVNIVKDGIYSVRRYEV